MKGSIQLSEKSNVIQFPNCKGPAVAKVKLTEINKVDPADDTLDKLVNMTNQTCLVSLDRTLMAVKRGNQKGFHTEAARVGSIAEAMVRAVVAVRECVTTNQRSNSNATT